MSNNETADPGEVVRRFFATLSTGDFAAIGEFFDDTSVWAVNNVDRGHPSKQGRRAIIDDFLQPVREGLFETGDPKIDVQRVLVDGDWVAAETIGRGTLLDGTPYENSYAFTFQIDGGTIRYMREYMDTAYAARVSQGARAKHG
jgi:uncharacterized protein